MLTTPPKLSLQSPRRIKKLNFFFEISLFYFSWKWSCGHEESSDHNLTEEFLTEGRKTLAQCTKTLKNHKVQKMIWIKILLTRWMQCWPPLRNYPRSLREWSEICTFFCKLHFSPPYVPMDTKNAVILTSPERFWRETENNSLNVKKTE